MTGASDRFDDRWVAVIGFALLVPMTLILFVTPPARSYEISIYAAYPWYFWVLAIVSLLLGFRVVLRSAINQDDRWVYGLLLVTAVFALLLFLPYFRGYPAFGRGDPLTHVGFIKDIQKTGTLGHGNIYPNLHSLVLGLSYATGIQPKTVLPAIAGFASLFSIVSSVVLLATLFDRRRALLSVPFVSVLVSIHPATYVVSTLLVPFVLYLFLKEQRSRALSARTALVLSIIGLVIYHPLTTLFFLLVFLVYGVALFVHRVDPFGDEADELPPVGPTPVLQLQLVTFVVWYFAFGTVVRRFQTVFQTILAPSADQSDLSSYSSTVSQYSPALFDLVRIGLLRYGKAAILLSIGGVYTLLVVLVAIRKRTIPTTVSQSMLVGCFVLFSGISIAFFGMNFVDLGFGRPLLFAKLFGGLLTGAFFHELLETSTLRRVGRAALYVAVAVLVVISTFGLYSSPYVIDNNPQVTKTELSGGEWYLEHRDPDHTLSEVGIAVYRLRDALYGRNTYPADKYIPGNRPPVPDRFNYTIHDTVGASYEEDRYLVITEFGRIFYPETYPEYRQFWGFTPSDFDRLERDQTVDHVYDSGGYDTYLVNGTGTG